MACSQEEAVDGWMRMTADRKALAPQLREDLAIVPPYSFGQIDEAAIRREVLEIFRRARPDTKIMYGLGHDGVGANEQNWIIRWLLWHVFRYRDDRNVGTAKRNARPASAQAENEDTELASSDTSDTADLADTVEAAANLSQGTLDSSQGGPEAPKREDISRNTARFWDPIRERYRDDFG